MQSVKPSRADRICVIGAGVSGLSAAHYLAASGYDRVTVVEREARVGGKCCSVRVGGRTYEMGAVLATRDYSVTRELMASVGIRGAPIGGMQCYDPEGHAVDLFPRSEIPRLIWQVLLRYAWDTRVRYRRINSPGLAGVHPDLHAPFAQFAQDHALPSLDRALSLPFTGFGYGYFEEVPAAYVMKYLDLPMIESLVSPSRRMGWPDGVEGLWTRVAADLDVRTGVTIQRITRGESVWVETDGGVLAFDHLILTSPLDEALDFIDASATERRLFGAIRTYNYWVLLCRLSGMPATSGYLPSHFVAERSGHLMMWYHRWPDEPLYVLYALDDGTRPREEIEATCAADLRHLGATLDDVLAVRCWKYFPHVGPEEMDAGYYETLEGLQGTRRTYYAGEIMSFATIEICARYARHLVQRYFAPARAGR